jgi:undecaprenyl-diphosphatase
MDYRLYRAVNDLVEDQPWLASVAVRLETWGVVALAIATVMLWLLARPGSERKWKAASGSALGAAGLALLVNQAIAKVWSRPRPYVSHPSAHVWTARSHDPSFPSDHASAAFAIATSVLLFDRFAGALFLVAAALIGVGRVVVGVHYPGDVAAGVVVGVACALLVGRLARPLVLGLVRVVERVTDPLVAPAWRLAGARRRSTRPARE